MLESLDNVLLCILFSSGGKLTHAAIPLSRGLNEFPKGTLTWPTYHAWSWKIVFQGHCATCTQINIIYPYVKASWFATSLPSKSTTFCLQTPFYWHHCWEELPSPSPWSSCHFRFCRGTVGIGDGRMQDLVAISSIFLLRANSTILNEWAE